MEQLATFAQLETCVERAALLAIGAVDRFWQGSPSRMAEWANARRRSVQAAGMLY